MNVVYSNCWSMRDIVPSGVIQQCSAVVPSAPPQGPKVGTCSQGMVLWDVYSMSGLKIKQYTSGPLGLRMWPEPPNPICWLYAIWIKPFWKLSLVLLMTEGHRSESYNALLERTCQHGRIRHLQCATFDNWRVSWSFRGAVQEFKKCSAVV